MNRIYRVVFNIPRGKFVVADERGQAFKKKCISTVCSVAIGCLFLTNTVAVMAKKYNGPKNFNHLTSTSNTVKVNASNLFTHSPDPNGYYSAVFLSGYLNKGDVRKLSVTVDAIDSSQDSLISAIDVKPDAAKNASFSGNYLKVVLNTDFIGSGNNAAIGLLHQSTSAAHTTTVATKESSIKVSSTNPNGKSVYGIAQTGKAKLYISGNSMSIDVSTNTVRADPNDYSEIVGVSINGGGGFTTGAKTNLVVNAISNGTDVSVSNIGHPNNKSGSSPVYGAFIQGPAQFNGTTEFYATAVGANSTALEVVDTTYNTSLVDTKYDAVANFNTLTANAKSTDGIVKGIDVVKLSDKKVELNIKGSSVVTATSDNNTAYGIYASQTAPNFTKDLTLTASGKEAYGIYLTDSANATLNGLLLDVKGTNVGDGIFLAQDTEIALNQTSQISAKNAFAGKGNIEANGDVSLSEDTLVGSGYEGKFSLKNGKMSLSDKNGFFGSLATVELGDKGVIEAAFVNESTVNVLNGGSLVANAIDQNAKITLASGANLTTDSSQLFKKDLGEDGKETVPGELTKTNIVFEEGSTLTLTDEFFNLHYVDELKDAGFNSLVMLGKLVEDPDANEGASLDAFGERDVALVNNSLTSKDKNVLIGTETLPNGWAEDTTQKRQESLSLGALDLGAASQILVTGGKELSLSGKDQKLVSSSGTDKSITVGHDSLGTGTLNFGTASASHDASFDGLVKLSSKGALNVAHGTYTVDELQSDTGGKTKVADQGSLILRKSSSTGDTVLQNGTIRADGVELTMGKVEAGSSSSLNADVINADSFILKGSSAVSAKKVTFGGGEISGGSTLTAASLEAKGETTVQDGGTLKADTLNLGKGTSVKVSSGGIVSVKDAKLNGASVVVTGTDTAPGGFEQGSKEINGSVQLGTLGRVAVGGSLQEADNSLKSLTGKIIGKDYSSAFYVKDNATVTETGGINGENGNVSFNKGHLLVVDAKAIANKAAFTYTGTTPAAFTMNEGSMLFIQNPEVGDKLILAEGFDPNNIGIQSKDIIFTQNRLIIGKAEGKDGKFIVGLTPLNAAEEFVGLVAPNSVNDAVLNKNLPGGKFVNSVLTSGASDEKIIKTLNQTAMFATAGAAQVVAVNSAGMIADTLDQHGSRLAAYNHEKSGADLWVNLNGSFSKASSYGIGPTDYGFKSDIAGATLGADYAFGNGLALGGAFSIGTGSARGQGNGSGIKNNIDYYGLSVYGVWSMPYANLIGSVGYVQGKNDITGIGLKAKPDTETVSLGIRLETPLQLNEIISVTPHIGLRYMHISMDSFSAGGFNYRSDNANLVQMPIGVAFNSNLKTKSGTFIKPFLDLQIAPAFGDRKATNKFGLTGGSAIDAFEARIADNAMYSAKIGLEVSKDSHSFGLNYGIASGNYGRVDQALQAKYRYCF